MKKLLLSVLFIIMVCDLNSQSSFEKGYIIDSNGTKIECFIKNEDWSNNPTNFEYKLSLDSKVKKATITTASEFVVLDKIKYVRYNVRVDRSDHRIGSLSRNKDLNLEEEELFLKNLIEGDASLYSYKDGNLIRYFYSTNEVNIRQLDYKLYLTQDNKVRKNDHYKQQLWTDVKCADMTIRNIENTNYTKKDLTKYFKKYNECKGFSYTNFSANSSKGYFNINIRPGINFNSVSVDDPREINFGPSGDVNFDNEINFRIGAEMEFVLPYNRNRFAFFIEPTYQSFKEEKTYNYTQANNEVREVKATIDYKSIEIPFGFRTYFNVNKSSKLFLNAAALFDIPMNSTLNYDDNSNFLPDYNLNVLTVSYVFGLGYNYKKYYLEARIDLGRNLLREVNEWTGKYKSFSLIFGYNLFGK